MSKQRFEVQRYHDHVLVARQSGDVPHPQLGEALIQMVACGICGADIRVVTKNKTASGASDRYITLGHEGVGRIIALNGNTSGMQIGDYVVVLPHVHKDERTLQCSASAINPVCIGNGHTLHMGWDIDGCFADFRTVPIANLVPVAPQYLSLATERAPYLREAVFSLVEPMLCTLSAYELIENRLQRDLSPGRALVIGCGPVGILHSLVLLQRGFEVWLMDTMQRRAELVQWCLDYRGHVFDQTKHKGEFDLVMVTASSAPAIKTSETLVREGGIVYLFAGLNTKDRSAMDNDNIFLYEPLHRKAQSISTSLRLTEGDKPVHYLGHSGYFERLAEKAVEAVATHASSLDRAITGIIPGFASERIISRLPGGVDWATKDKSPAIVSVLKGMDLRGRHCKVIVKLNEEEED
jgi:threonine dehydrogenase-like Zn-dependent dehydrogenase